MPVGGLSSRTPGIARVQELALDVAALASVRGRDAATLTAFPLGADATVTLAVERFEPFTAGATAVVMEDAGPRKLALPDQRYYRGTVAGEPGSLAVVVLGADTARGFVSRGGTIYRFGRDRTGVYRSWALRDADPAVFPGPGAFCANDTNSDQVRGHAGRTGTTAVGRGPATDGGLHAHAPRADGDRHRPGAAGEVPGRRRRSRTWPISPRRLGDLRRRDRRAGEVPLHPALGHPRSWTATTRAALDQLQNYWITNEGATPRDVTHLVSGKTVVGGIAYIDALCDPAYGYGVSQSTAVRRDGSRTTPGTSSWSRTSSATTSAPSTRTATCRRSTTATTGAVGLLQRTGVAAARRRHHHELLPPAAGGMSNVNLEFGPRSRGVMRGVAEDGICIGPPAATAARSGRGCDDGNNVSGDCCSASLHRGARWRCV